MVAPLKSLELIAAQVILKGSLSESHLGRSSQAQTGSTHTDTSCQTNI